MVFKKYSKYKKKNMKYAMIRKGNIIIVVALHNISRKSKRKTQKHSSTKARRMNKGGAGTNDKKNTILNLATDIDVIKKIKELNPDKAKSYSTLLDEIRKNPTEIAKMLPDEVYSQIEQKGQGELDELKQKNPQQYDSYQAGRPPQLELLLDFIENSKTQRNSIKSALEKLQSDKLITPEQAKRILATVNNNEPSTITKIGQGTLNALGNISTSLGNWFAPPLGPEEKAKPNVSHVQILWMPASHSVYKKTPYSKLPSGLDELKPGDGDIMVYIDKTSYSSTWEYFKKQFNGVDDIFANILNAISGSDTVRSAPLKKETIDVIDDEPNKNKERLQKAYHDEVRKLT